MPPERQHRRAENLDLTTESAHDDQLAVAADGNAADAIGRRGDSRRLRVSAIPTGHRVVAEQQNDHAARLVDGHARDARAEREESDGARDGHRTAALPHAYFAGVRAD